MENRNKLLMCGGALALVGLGVIAYYYQLPRESNKVQHEELSELDQELI